MVSHSFIEKYPALEEFPDLTHGFVLRDPAIDVKTDRDTALARLEQHHVERLNELGISRDNLATGQQVHGNAVAVHDPETINSHHYVDTDGLITATAGQSLGVFVADCGAVFLADRVKRACGVVHSGKKGTELKIVVKAIEAMQRSYGSDPADLVIQIAPCIRPPEYEIDFAAQIVADAIAAGVPESQVHDCGICTTSDPDRYYSYRKEMGKTGRLFAVIGWRT